ncbi:hypothetical protein [Candidatus Palauibacter sp.]|uniref:hypothetical protein n=1 Tax=Candidatus Palauibacter sp. TaxID=3101350 RepID=UPI003AF25F46
MGDEDAGARRVRHRTLLRWMTAGVAVLALAASLASVVQRGEDGRRLTAELGELEAEARIAGDRIDVERARVDSLTTPARIEREAEMLGLHRAVEEQLLQVDAASSRDGEGTDVSTEGGDK